MHSSWVWSSGSKKSQKQIRLEDIVKNLKELDYVHDIHVDGLYDHVMCVYYICSSCNEKHICYIDILDLYGRSITEFKKYLLECIHDSE